MNMNTANTFGKEHSDHPPEWQSKELCIMCLIEVLTDAEPIIFKKKVLLDCLLNKLDQEREFVLRNNGHCFSPSTPIIAKLMEEPELPSGLIILLIDCVASFGDDLAPLSTRAALSVLSAVVVDISNVNLVKEMLIIVISKVLEPDRDGPANMLILMRKIVENYTSCKSFVFKEKQFLQHTVGFINSTDANLSNASVGLLTVLFQDEDPVLDLCSPEMVANIATKLCRLLRVTEIGISEASVLTHSVSLELIALIGTRKEAKEIFLYKDEELNLIPGIKTFLMSRSSALQVEVLNVLLVLLKDSQTDHIMVVLNGDITEHLFELLYQNNFLLVELILLCLRQLITCDAFFCRPYSKFGIEPLFRCMQLLLERNASVLLISQGIQLVNALLSKYEEFSVSRSTFHLSLAVVSTLISSAFPELRLAGNRLLQTLLCKEYISKPIPMDNVLKLLDVMFQNFDRIRCSYDVGYSQVLGEKRTENVQYMASVFLVVSSCLKLMNRYKGEAICWLSSYSIGNSPSSQSQSSQIPATPLPGSSKLSGPEEEDQMLDKLLNFQAQVWWPFLANHVGTVECPYWWSAMVDCLTAMAGYDTDSSLPRCLLALVSCNKTFLDTLLKLRLRLSDQDAHDGKSALDTFIALLITAFLNSVGEKEDRQCFVEAVSQVPLDLSQWNAFLYCNASPVYAKTCVLVLRYFMESSSDEIFADADDQFLQSLCKILSTLTKPAPRYLYTVLWFLTARHSAEPNDVTALMLQALEVQMAQDPNVLTAYYTHHPCLLHFALATSECAKLLGPKVLALWLSTACESEREAAFYSLVTDATDRVLAASLMVILEETSEASRYCLMYLQRFINVLSQEDETQYKHVVTEIGNFFGTFLLQVLRRIKGRQDGSYIGRITSALTLFNNLAKEPVCLGPISLRRDIVMYELEDRHIKLFTTFMTFLPKTPTWSAMECQAENEWLSSSDLDLFYEASFRCLFHLIASPCGTIDKQMIQLIANDGSFIAFINRLLHVDILLCIPWVVRLITLVLIWRHVHPQPVVPGRIFMPEAVVLTRLSFRQPTTCNQAILDFICMSFQVDDRLDVLECQWVHEPTRHVHFLKLLMFRLQDLVFKMGHDLEELVWSCYDNWWQYVKRRAETEHEKGERFRCLLTHPSHTRFFKVLPVAMYEACAAAHRVKQSIESL